MNTISVIIPCFNSQHTLSNCLRSIVDGKHKPQEIIIVDDCSSDKTGQIAAHFITQYPKQIKYLKLDSNSGPAFARNAGARIAKSSYLFFADSDTEFLTDTLSNFLTSIQSNKADAVVGIYDSTPINKGACPSYKAHLNFFFFSRLGTITYEVFDSSRAGIKTSVFIQSGGFNSNLKKGMDYENEEFGYRLIEKYRLILDPSIRVRHHFPYFLTMTKAYFFRVALWAKLFFSRKKFESGGVTSTTTGLSSISLLISLFLLLLDLFFYKDSSFFVFGQTLAIIFFMIYLSGYIKFFAYIYKCNFRFLLSAITLNIFFTLVIALGALYGLTTELVSLNQFTKRNI